MADLATPETAELLAELERRTRDAWNAYRDRLGDLSGRAYDAAERDSWATLQAELRAIEGDRSGHAGALADDVPGA